MRVLHCCLANFYVDGYSYQENILARLHVQQGHEVAIVASRETYINNRDIGYTKASSYKTEDGIPITRLPYGWGLPLKLAAKLRLYRGLRHTLDEFAPDLLFVHDCQFLDARIVADYAAAHPELKIFVDSHTDFGNSARNWLSKHILHGILYRYCAKVIEPHTTLFFGTLPARMDFYRDVYGIPEEKLALLTFGAEDAKVPWDRAPEIREEVRKRLHIGEGDLLLVTGGKIDRRKNIHRLMRSVQEIGRDDIKLVVFGIPGPDIEDEFNALSDHDSVRCVGWLESDEVYSYLLAADLVVFPGSHSVLWEQAVGVGTPCLFRRWEGMEHVDVGGNCLFLDGATSEELQTTILRVADEPTLLSSMREVSMTRGRQEFSYWEIAKRALKG
jgi:1,2-diacylglycerol 3-alpha-glucosyltransferase